MRTFFSLLFVALAFVSFSPQPTYAADMGTCNCSGSLTGDQKFIPPGEFDSKVCSAATIKTVCGQCSNGVASSCQLQFPTTQEQCDNFNNKDPQAVNTYFGVPNEYEINVNPSMKCTFFASKAPSAAGASQTASGGSGGSSGLIPKECLGAANVNSCGIQSLVNVFVLVANFIIGICGSLAFIFFIYGGFRWLTSGGSPEKIKEGKTIITNAVIGLIIIFGARAGIDFVRVAITKGANTKIPGNSCKPTSPSADKSIQPRYFQFDETISCIGSCSDLASASGLPYECGKPASGATCAPNLCEGGKDNVCCIKGSGTALGMKCACSGSGINITGTIDTKDCSTAHCVYNGMNPDTKQTTCTCGDKTIEIKSSPDNPISPQVVCESLTCTAGQ